MSRYREVLLKLISLCAVALLVSFGLCGVSLLGSDAKQNSFSTLFLVAGVVGYFGILAAVLGFVIVLILLSVGRGSDG